MEKSSVSNLGNALVSLGGLLIVIGILVFVSASWQSFSPTGRILTASLPLVLLLIISLASWGRSEYHRYAHYTLLTASFILPFVAGVIIYQSGLYEEVDSRMIFFCSIISLPFYLLFEYFLRQKEQAWYVVSALAIGTLAYLGEIDANFEYFPLAGIILGIPLLLLGYFFIRKKLEEEGHLYSIAGFTLYWLGLVFWPLTYYIRVSFGVADRSNAIYWLTLGSAAVGVVLFITAAIYGILWLRNKNRSYLQIRQMAEQTTPIIFVGPATLVALFSQDSSHTIIALILAAILIALSHVVRLTSYRSLGYIALLVALIRLIFFAISELSAFWPILLVVGGFILIGAAYLLTHLKTRQLVQWLWQKPERSLFGLGELPPPPPPSSFPASFPAGSVPPPPSQMHSSDTGWQWLVILLVVLALLIFL